MSETRVEKLALLGLAGFNLVVLAIIAVMILRVGTLDANAAGMIGVIVTGLVALPTVVIQAIRGYSMSAQLGKVTDQLAASTPQSTEDEK